MKTIEEDADFIRVVLPNDAVFLLVKSKLPSDKLAALQLILSKVKNSKTAFQHLN